VLEVAVAVAVAVTVAVLTEMTFFDSKETSTVNFNLQLAAAI